MNTKTIFEVMNYVLLLIITFSLIILGIPFLITSITFGIINLMSFYTKTMNIIVYGLMAWDIVLVYVAMKSIAKEVHDEEEYEY